MLYLLAVPLTDILALHRWLPPPVAVLIPLICAYVSVLLVRPHFAILSLVPEDALFLAFLTSLSFSTFVNATWLDYYSLSHLLSYFIVVGCFYYLFRLIAVYAKVPLDRMMNALIIGVLITSFVGIYEFILRNVYVDGSALTLPGRISDRGGDYTAIYAGFGRSRAFMAESGLMALYLELIAPVVIFYLVEKRRFVRTAIVSFTAFSGLLVTVSVAALASLSIAIFTALLVYICAQPKRIISLTLFVLMSVSVISLVSDQRVSDYSLFHKVVDKISLRGHDASSKDRLNRWKNSLAGISKSPLIGYGAGSFKAAEFNIGGGGGIVSLWLQIMFEGGIIALLVFLCAYAMVMYRALLLRSTRRYGYLISLSAGLVHYAVISDYWKPWIWLVLAIVIYDASEMSKRKVIW